MRDIVATLQAEQGEITRVDRPEVLVIEGGPGTGTWSSQPPSSVNWVHQVVEMHRGPRTPLE
jgi:hypothetical protein